MYARQPFLYCSGPALSDLDFFSLWFSWKVHNIYIYLSDRSKILLKCVWYTYLLVSNILLFFYFQVRSATDGSIEGGCVSAYSFCHQVAPHTPHHKWCTWYHKWCTWYQKWRTTTGLNYQEREDETVLTLFEMRKITTWTLRRGQTILN